MSALAFERAAFTAFLEPGGFGPLYVWSVPGRSLLRACLQTPGFDPSGSARSLLLGGCLDGSHPGREALEDRARDALAYPERPGPLRSGSSMGRRRSALAGPGGRALDGSMGYLDLLLTLDADPDLPPPRSAARRPREALSEGMLALWGLEARYCGVVDEEDWDSFEQRAAAVLALLERSEMMGAGPFQAGLGEVQHRL